MRIAIVKLSALGDIVHAMVVLQFIKNNQSDISIDWIVEEQYKDLLESHPDIDSVHSISLKRAKKKQSILAFFRAVRKVHKLQKYDLVIDMQGLIKSAVISKFIPSYKIVGFNKSSAREGFASNFYNKKYKINYAENIVIRNLGIINYAMSINVSKNKILQKKPFLIPNSKYNFSEISKVRNNILLVPGASFLAKSYPVESYIEVVKRIDANFIVIWGDEKEKKMAEAISIGLSKVKICKKISLNQLISLISQIDLVIGSDTGPTHMAWAMNIPSITLFGATPGYRNSFQTMSNHIIESDSKVNPLKINKEDFSIINIKVNDIVKMAKHLLKL